jgi:hypothetical protein
MNTETKLIAFHGDPRIKETYLARVRQHRAADELVKGQYWENGKGCAVGCTIHSDDHCRYETELGIPQALARLEDSIFEALPNDKAMAWPEQFLAAIPVGADLSLVTTRFLHWLLVDPVDGVVRFAEGGGKAAIEQVAELFAREIEGGTVVAAEWHDAATAVETAEAAAYATRAADARAAYAADAYAAVDAVNADARAANAAAFAARDAAYASEAAAYAAEAAEGAFAAARAANAAVYAVNAAARAAEAAAFAARDAAYAAEAAAFAARAAAYAVNAAARAAAAAGYAADAFAAAYAAARIRQAEKLLELLRDAK